MKNKIVWSEQSKNDLLAIRAFYDKRNKSSVYSKKLFQIFKNAAELLSKYPLLSIGTDQENIRGFIIKSYILFFEIKIDCIYILTVWDTRRDPGQIDKLLKQ